MDEQWEQLTQQVVQLYNQGKYAEAIIIAQQALNLALSLSQGDHPLVATSLSHLAYLCNCQGRYEQAEPLLEDALAMTKRLFEGDHPYVASSLNNLAELYHSQGRYEKAELLYKEAMAMTKRLFQGDHPHITASLNNLAELYRDQGRYEQAKPLYEEALAMTKRLFEGNHPAVATSLNNLALLCKSQGRYEQAKPLYEQALLMLKRLFPGDHPDVAGSLNNLAELYHSQGRYEKAELLYKEAMAMTKRLFQGDHPHITASLNNLAELYRDQGRYEQAKPLYEQALAITKRLFEGDHPAVATSLNNLAALYESQGRYEQAKPLYEDALAMRKRLFQGDHPDVATSLSSLAGIYYYQGRYEQAKPLLEKALAMRKRLFQGDHPDVATSLNNLAGLYYYQGRYEQAKPLYEEALAMRNRLFGSDHPAVATSLSSLAVLYKSQGRYEQAEPLFKEALAMRKRLFQGDHPDVASSLNNLAYLCNSQGRYEEAKPLYEEALAMKKRLFQGDHPQVALSLNNLAAFHSEQGRYEQAEPLYEQALAMTKRLFQGDHPDVALSFNNLAYLYFSQRRYEEAELLYKKALAMKKRLFQGDHPDVALSLNNLALLYYSQGRYEQAEPLYEEALAMFKRLFQGDHPLVATNLNNLAMLLVQTSRPTEALERMKQATEVEDKIISRVFGFSSERERLAHLERNRTTFYLLLSLVLNHLQDSPAAVQTALDVVFKRKALSAAAQAAFSEAVHSGRYPHLMPQFQQLRDLSNQIIKIYHSQPEPEQRAAMTDRLVRLQGEYDNLERQLAAQVPEIQLQKQLASRQAVARKLPAGSTLLEFVCFDVYDFTAPKGEEWQPGRYIAFVLPAQQPDAVQMIDLGAAEPIDKLIKVFRQSASLDGDNLGNRLNMSWDEAETASPFLQYDATTGVPLRQAIFDQIRPVITDYQSLRIAPDGDLNLLPFQLLPSDDKGEKLLMDEYNISYLSAGRDVLRSQVQPNRPAGAPLIMADPDFDLGLVSRPVDIAKDTHLEGTMGQILSTLEGKPFKRAPGTRYLGEAVAKKLGVQPHLDAEAVEPRLTNGNCPRILLIATHGVFWAESQILPQPTFGNRELITSLRKSGTEPMMRSGLALAGANTSLFKQPLPPEAGKGLVFAQDVAALDLWANELTVLSACETGIGDVKIGEGVFGLRRAFPFAGSKTLLMSLWSVPDKATALLMNRFFDNLRQGLGRADALAEAQNYLRNVTVAELRQFYLGQEILADLLAQNNPACQEDDTPLSHPFFWGAWVCQGDITGFDL